MTFERIAAVLTLITAVTGILVAFTDMSYIVVAIAGVCAGLWWAFGRMFMPRENASKDRIGA